MIGAVDQQVRSAVERGFERSPATIAKKGGGELRRAAQDFEAIFVSMMLKSMRQTVKKSGFISGGRGEEVFEGLLDMHIAESASRKGRGMGIAEMLIKQYSKSIKTTEDTMEGAAVKSASGESIGSSGGSSVFRGYPLTDVREGEREWIG